MPKNEMLDEMLDQVVKRIQHSIQHLKTKFVFDLDQTSSVRVVFVNKFSVFIF